MPRVPSGHRLTYQRKQRFSQCVSPVRARASNCASAHAEPRAVVPAVLSPVLHHSPRERRGLVCGHRTPAGPPFSKQKTVTKAEVFTAQTRRALQAQVDTRPCGRLVICRTSEAIWTKREWGQHPARPTATGRGCLTRANQAPGSGAGGQPHWCVWFCPCCPPHIRSLLPGHPAPARSAGSTPSGQTRAASCRPDSVLQAVGGALPCCLESWLFFSPGAGVVSPGLRILT